MLEEQSLATRPEKRTNSGDQEIYLQVALLRKSWLSG